MSTFTTLLELPNGEEIEVIVEFDYSPLIPESINCLPEDATPAEGGEVELISLKAMDSEHSSLTLFDLASHQYQQLVDDAENQIAIVEENLLDLHGDAEYENWKEGQLEEA